MEYQKMIAAMSREVYDNLMSALERGKWPDGNAMTQQQREETMQAVISWGQMHLPAEQRIGYIDLGSKAGDDCDNPEELPLNWQE